MNSKGTLYILIGLLIAAVLSSIGTVVYHFSTSNYKTEAALSTTVDDAISIDAVFIRDETVITTNRNGVISYEVDDASKLGINSVIANVYQTDADVDLEKRIAALEKKVDMLKNVQNPGTSLSARPSNMASKISDIYRNMLHNREKGNISDIVSEKDNLLSLFTTYQLLTDDTADFTGAIASINNTITDLESKQNPAIETIKSNISGYFISYTDGYEKELKTDIIDTITEDQINAVTDSGAVESAGVIGKIAKGYKWYAVGVTDMNEDEIQKYTTGSSVTIKFSSTNLTAEAQIESVRDASDGKKIIVVSSEDFDKEFVQHRKEKIKLVKAEYTGIKVPISDLRSNDEVVITETDENGNEQVIYDKNNPPTGVYILNGNESEYKLVDIIYRNEKEGYVISALTDDNRYVNLYDSIITEGVGYNGS